MSADDFMDFSRRLLDHIAGQLGIPHEELIKDFPVEHVPPQPVDPAQLAADAIAAAASLEIVSWHGEGDVGQDDPLVRGGVGGIDRHDPPWDEYLASWLDPADRARLTRLKAHLVEHGNKRGGWWHQREGIPRFSDGSYMFMSMRGWGDLQAAIWGGHYCHYAWED
jgi:hypothetical protein